MIAKKGHILKKITKGRKYDPDTAQFMGSREFGAPGDSGYCLESLYRKKTGESFLLGEGNPQSRYSRSLGQNNWSSGKEIIPLNWNTADEWASDNLDADRYEEIFGPVSEAAEGSVQVGARISAAAKQILDREVSRTSRTVNEIIQDLITNHLDKA